MDEDRRISQGLNRTLEEIFGDDVMTHIRRTAIDLDDDIDNLRMQLENEDSVIRRSGSYAEGFWMRSSDFDLMWEYSHIRVVPSFYHTSSYDCNAVTVVMMENERTKPGFSLLRLLKSNSIQFLRLTTERLFNAQYVSSKLWRELHFATSANRDMEFIHGPCTSAIGSIEYDMAHTLRCDIWPHDARDCIKRLNQCRWPSNDTVQSINYQWWCSICPYWCKGVEVWKHRMEDVVLFGREETRSCHESYSVFMLWTAEIIS